MTYHTKREGETKTKTKTETENKKIDELWVHCKDHLCHLGGKAPPAAFGRIGFQYSIKSRLPSLVPFALPSLVQFALPSLVSKVSNTIQISMKIFKNESLLIQITHEVHLRLLNKKIRWLKGVFFLLSLGDAWVLLLLPSLLGFLFYTYCHVHH